MDPGDYVSLDSEISPTISPQGVRHREPTQVALTDLNGKVLFNEYFVPEFKTSPPMSKQRKEKIMLNTKRSYAEAKPDLLKLIQSKIIIGHDLFHDFNALGIDPVKDGIQGVIDTAKLPYFSHEDIKLVPKSLKELVKTYLKKNIQSTMHNASEDAKATANLVRSEFAYLNSPGPITERSIEKSKKILEYAERKTLAQRPVENNKSKNASAAIGVKSSNDLIKHLPIKTASEYLKEMEGLNLSNSTPYTGNNSLKNNFFNTKLNSSNNLFAKSRKTAKNYLEEMGGLYAKPKPKPKFNIMAPEYVPAEEETNNASSVFTATNNSGQTERSQSSSPTGNLVNHKGGSQKRRTMRKRRSNIEFRSNRKYDAE